MTERKMVAVAPLFDEVTEFSFEWCNDVLDEIEEQLDLLTELMDSAAVKSSVESALERDQPNWFIHYDHGSEYVLWGDDEKAVIDLSNLSKLAGMHVYNMNCSSGKGLGSHAVDSGIVEYLGYLDPVAFTTDATEVFKKALNYGLIKAIKEDLPLKDVVEDMRENGYTLADQLRAEGNFIAAGALVQDMNILHVYYEGGPPPPPPPCPVSRGLLALLGWNGLKFFRMLRQKIFPEHLLG